MESRVESLVRRWRVFWLWHAGHGFWGRIGSRLASFGAKRYRHRHALAQLTPCGYIEPSAEVIDNQPVLGANVFVGERAVLARWGGQGSITLADKVTIHRDCSLELCPGGAISIGEKTALERGCILVSAVHPIRFGRNNVIAAYCAFYSYDHGITSGRGIAEQPLCSKGPIVLEDDVWLGVGVTVLSGVTIGSGAVIGAGSVVTRDIPSQSIAAGIPARPLKSRSQLNNHSV
ncbi:MAG: DapH/DapD/GlmU-related protein [Verrucomicrobiota bacterium]